MLSTDPRCFDAALAALRVREVRLDQVTDLLPLSHGHNTIALYRARMLSGERFPPVSVLPLFGRLVITDGHKRYHAARPLVSEPVPVELWTLRRLLADQWRQVRANARKNGRIVAGLFVDPAESMRLMRTTALHWLRVVRCLGLLLVTPRARRR